MLPKKPAAREQYIKVGRAKELFARFEIGIARSVLSAHPENRGALEMLGDALARAKRYEEALRVDLKVAQLWPKSEQAFYNLACTYSQLGQADEGLEALSKALNLGFRNFNRMMTDGDLENVRRHPHFKKLLDRKWGKRQP